MQIQSDAFRDRVRAAAEAVLEADGSVGPIELFECLGFLPSRHIELWRNGHDQFQVLEPCVQLGAAKFDKVVRHFQEWGQERSLSPTEVPYTRCTPSGVQPLRVTADGNAERERFYRTRYVPTGLSAHKAKRLSEKLSKAPDLVVFEKVTKEGHCSECGGELGQGSLLAMENSQPLCLACADLDHLVFLPRGDTALSRRGRKLSPLSAIVVRFSRSRRRYERQGVLITSEALAQAEAQCAADAPERAARRAEAAVAREIENRELVQTMTAALLKLYPGCPPGEARAIAAHTAERSSGRVGRSAAGRELDPQALHLAVRAHIRHNHTNYDELLMGGTERHAARARIGDAVERVVTAWAGGR